MHSIHNQFITPISQKDKSVSLHNHQDQVELFCMLQNMHTNYSQKAQVYTYKRKPKSLKTNILKL